MLVDVGAQGCTRGGERAEDYRADGIPVSRRGFSPTCKRRRERGEDLDACVK